MKQSRRYKIMFTIGNKICHHSSFCERHRAIQEMERLFYSGTIDKVYVLDSYIIIAELERSVEVVSQR